MIKYPVKKCKLAMIGSGPSASVHVAKVLFCRNDDMG